MSERVPTPEEYAGMRGLIAEFAARGERLRRLYLFLHLPIGAVFVSMYVEVVNHLKGVSCCEET